MAQLLGRNIHQLSDEILQKHIGPVLLLFVGVYAQLIVIFAPCHPRTYTPTWTADGYR